MGMLDKIERKEIKLPDAGNNQITKLIKQLNKSIMQKGFDGYFHLFRARIEKMLEDGYSMQPITQEDIDKQIEFNELVQIYKAKSIAPQPTKNESDNENNKG